MGRHGPSIKDGFAHRLLKCWLSKYWGVRHHYIPPHRLRQANTKECIATSLHQGTQTQSQYDPLRCHAGHILDRLNVCTVPSSFSPSMTARTEFTSRSAGIQSENRETTLTEGRERGRH